MILAITQRAATRIQHIRFHAPPLKFGKLCDCFLAQPIAAPFSIFRRNFVTNLSNDESLNVTHTHTYTQCLSRHDHASRTKFGWSPDNCTHSSIAFDRAHSPPSTTHNICGRSITQFTFSSLDELCDVNAKLSLGIQCNDLNGMGKGKGFLSMFCAGKFGHALYGRSN